MPSRSEPQPQSNRRRILLVAVVAAAILVVPVVRAAADIINTSRFLVTEDSVQAEDAYVAANSGVVEGLIEGDLVIAAGSLSVTGTVTGDVFVAARGNVTVDGVVEGSLRGVARSVSVTGLVGDDIAVAAVRIDVSGSVGRDLIGLGGTASATGDIGRDIKGRYLDLTVGGSVGRDVDVTVRDLELASEASIAGDVVYQADRDANVAPTAVVAGQTIKLPTDAPFYVGLVLDVAGVLGFLGYLVAGIVLLWLLRRTSAHAVAAAADRPGLSIGLGLAAAVVLPVVTVVLVATLVGIPLALVVLLTAIAGVLFASVPAVAAVGYRVLGGRGGIYGGFLAAAIAWRLLAAFVPVAGAVLFVVAEMWGAGSWIIGAWRARQGPLDGAAQLISELPGQPD